MLHINNPDVAWLADEDVRAVLKAIVPDDIVPVRVERYGALPAFGTVYSDAKMASVVNYVTARFGAKGSRLFVGDLLAMRDH